MALPDPLSQINPNTVGYGKSGSNPYKADDQYDYHKGAQEMIRKIMAHHSSETSNLTKENLETIMGHIGEIVGNKVDKYTPLDRSDKEHFRHKLEQEFQHGALSRDDINDAWKIWDNFAKH